MARLDSFLTVIAEQNASDLHLSAGAVPAVRRDGNLHKLPFRATSCEEVRRFLFEVLSASQQESLEENQSLDFVHEVERVGRFRGNIFFHAAGLGAAFRIIPDSPPDLDQIHLPPTIGTLADARSGLVLICGPTGAGKTTTLAAMVHRINASRLGHVVTVEDPIEFVHRSNQSVITQRQVGSHTRGFAPAVRSALRESPDVLVIGEIRDRDTLALALDAASRGILVLTTLHANTAAGVVHRVSDLCDEAKRPETLKLLSEVFVGIVTQRLLPRAADEGRIPVMEILLRNQATSQMILEAKAHQLESYLLSANASAGMSSFDGALAKLVTSGEVSREVARAEARDVDALEALLGPSFTSSTSAVAEQKR